MVLAFTLTNCENTTNYSYQIKEEKLKIEAYIARNGITVISEFPADSVFPANTYYNVGEDSIYFRLDSKGTGIPAEYGDKLQIRYIESTLDEYPTIESYWTTQDLEYPQELTFGSTTSSCVGWQSAFAHMRQSGAVAEIIVPSRIGLSKATTTTSVTPYHYKMKFQILPH